MTTKTIVIKLGGAAITEKHCDQKISSNLDALLVQLLPAFKRYRVILIHGAGGYGHPTAKQYNLVSGWSSSDQVYGFAKTRAHVLELHGIVLNKLLGLGVAAISVPPFDHTMTENGHSPKNTLVDRVHCVLDQGFVPLLFGDGVLDSSLGCTILSGDVIMYQLAKQLDIERCVFITDVDGVYSANPKTHTNARLIRQIKIGQEQELEMTATDARDVTGGMHGKLISARQITKHCPCVVICQRLDSGALDPILPPDFTGTQITLAHPTTHYRPQLVIHAFLAFAVYYTLF